MITLAHIINPVWVDASSDLYTAQPITYETMRAALEFTKKTDKSGYLGVELFAVQSRDEERVPLPGCFTRLPDLRRSITDIKTFTKKRNLPLIKDILDSLYEASRADFFIYTNMDIGLMPYFYSTVSKFIEKGYDSFVINRRTIRDRYRSPLQIPQMYAETGEPHKGYDCFVFKRSLYPNFKLETICLGTAWIGRTLLANLAAYSTRYKEYRNRHLTFHIGDACGWRNPNFSDYMQENWNTYLSIFHRIEEERGPLDPEVRSYLIDAGDKRLIPDFERYYISKGILKESTQSFCGGIASLAGPGGGFLEKSPPVPGMELP